MAQYDPEGDVLAQLDGNFGLVRESNLFRGPVQATYGNTPSPFPAQAVFVRFVGGPKPINLDALGAAGRDADYEANVQLLIRGNPSTYGSTRILANNLYNLLHDRPLATPRYMAQRAQTAYPVYIATDERQCPLFSLVMRLRWSENP